MTHCVESLRSLVHDKIRWLKQNKYLANADWMFIETNFRIENPHTSSNENSHAVTHPQTTAIELNRTEYEDLFEEARIRIINIQKVNTMSFDWKRKSIFQCRQAFGGNIVIMRFPLKVFAFFRRCVTSLWIEKENTLVLIS